MGLIFTNIIYSIVFIILATKEFITDKYDHDVDQFMYFGSRILHGELIWTVEFDDKSPVIQYIFSLPAIFKSTSIFVFITLIVSLISALLGYKLLKDIIQKTFPINYAIDDVVIIQWYLVLEKDGVVF